jgi:hypothetical protein
VFTIVDAVFYFDAARASARMSPGASHPITPTGEMKSMSHTFEILHDTDGASDAARSPVSVPLPALAPPFADAGSATTVDPLWVFILSRQLSWVLLSFIPALAAVTYFMFNARPMRMIFFATDALVFYCLFVFMFIVAVLPNLARYLSNTARFIVMPFTAFLRHLLLCSFSFRHS